MSASPSPNSKCNNCKINDWTWTETTNEWKCTNCNVTGTTLIEDIDLWVNSNFTDYDLAYRELQEVKDLPHESDGQAILYLGRLKRAERNLAIAGVKADAASLIQSLRLHNTKGEISLDLPEVKLNIKLQW